MMPRITASRCLKLFLLPWAVMIGAWLFLPSLTVSKSGRDGYISRGLAVGRPVVTVHKWDNSFDKSNNRGRMTEGNKGDTTMIGIRWQLLSANRDRAGVALSIGDHFQLELFNTIEKANDKFAASIAERLEEVPYFGDSIRADVWAGGPEHPYNMPWFATSDAVLFHHEFHGMKAWINLCAIVPRPGIVEIWKQELVEEAMHRVMVGGETPIGDEGEIYSYTRYADTIEAKGDIKRSSNISRTIYDQLEPYRTDSGLLATFEDDDFKDRNAISGRILHGDLPSRTFFIRRALIFPLGPLPMIFGFIFLFIIPTVLIHVGPYVLCIYAFSVVAMWLYSGSPNPVEWGSQYWLTSFLCCCCRGRLRKDGGKPVWGPSGPILGPSSWNDLDRQESNLGLQRPMSVKFGTSNERRWVPALWSGSTESNSARLSPSIS